MKNPSLKAGSFIGGALTLPLLGLFYLGEMIAASSFVPYDVFDWLARNLPGSVVTVAIDALVQFIYTFNIGPTSATAKTMEQSMALLFFVVGGGLLGGLIVLISRRGLNPVVSGGIVSLIVLGLLLMVEANVPAGSTSFLATSWLAMLTIGWGLLTGVLIQTVDRTEFAPDGRSRRSVLAAIAGAAAAIGFASWGLGKLFKGTSENGAAEAVLNTVPTSTAPAATLEPPTEVAQSTVEATATLAAGRDEFVAAPGTRPELTSNEEFYRIDINTRPVSIDEEGWQLEIAGLFESPRFMSLDDIRSYPAVTQPITLSCISNRVGGDLIGTSNWTGVQLGALLENLGISPQAKELMIDSADGFYESVSSEDMMDPRTLLVYAMNGELLPQEHGFPLRIYIPNRYGMKQPKWIIRLTAVEEPVLGYWVVRGWSKEARPQIVSVIDTVAKEEPSSDGRVPVGGIAWAGDRGIQQVELQVDEGEWQLTTIRTPPLSPLTWVQWRFDWVPEPGEHTFAVRATDGEGELQIEKVSGVRPDGATGYHSVKVKI